MLRGLIQRRTALGEWKDRLLRRPDPPDGSLHGDHPGDLIAMRVHLELYASLMQYLPSHTDRHKVMVDMPSGSTAHNFWTGYHVPRERRTRCCATVSSCTRTNVTKPLLADGDVIAVPVRPPVAGDARIARETIRATEFSLTKFGSTAVGDARLDGLRMSGGYLIGQESIAVITTLPQAVRALGHCASRYCASRSNCWLPRWRLPRNFRGGSSGLSPWRRLSARGRVVC